MDHVKAFKALGDPIRSRILELLPAAPSMRDFRDGYNVNQLVELTGSSQPNVSHHLKILKDSGLIRQEKVRNNIYYYKNVEAIRSLRDHLTSLGGD